MIIDESTPKIIFDGLDNMAVTGYGFIDYKMYLFVDGVKTFSTLPSLEFLLRLLFGVY